MALKVANGIDMMSTHIDNCPDPLSAQQPATMAYVDARVNGLVMHPDVVVIIDANNGGNITKTGTQTLDGVALSAGMRVLLTAQTAAAENGPWVVQSGAWTRPADFVTGSTPTLGAYFLAYAGTLYRGHAWIMTNTTAVTVDTTALTFQEWTGLSDVTVVAPIVKTGNQLSLGTVPVANGGTGATTPTGARTNLGATGKFAVSVGNGSLTTITVNHALGTTDVTVQIFAVSTGAQVFTDVVVVDGNNITVTFATAPSSNQYRVVVIG